jgi:RNA polymerase sigma-70 factor (ECF subfamily)
MTAISLARDGIPTMRAKRATLTRKQQFDQLIGVYMDDLFRYAYWLSGDRAVADDLVQETLMRAWKSMDRLNESKAAKGWLLTILRRENARRFERRRLQQSSFPTEELAATRQEYDTSTEAFVLRRALEQLPADYREPLLLQVIYGYSQKEIANHLGISVAGAGTRLFRAREKMRELL